MKNMSAEEVHDVSTKQTRTGDKEKEKRDRMPRHRTRTGNNQNRKPATCRYCGLSHTLKKQKCPAYGKKCTNLSVTK